MLNSQGISGVKNTMTLTCPDSLVRAQPAGVAPQDVAGVAVVRGQGARDVLAPEVGHLDEAVLHRAGMVALHL